MSNLIQKAKRGDSASLEKLYANNAQEVFAVCLALLCREEEAKRATLAAFKKAWEELFAGKLSDEAAFSDCVLRRAVGICRAKVQNANSHAFRVPAQRNFIGAVYGIQKAESGNPDCWAVLRNLPELHRFAFALHTMGGFGDGEVAKILGIGTVVLRELYAVEEKCVEYIAALLQKESGRALSYTAKDFSDQLVAQKTVLQMAPELSEEAKKAWEAISQPIAHRYWKKQMRICTVFSSICLVLVAALIIGILGHIGQATVSEGEQNAEETEGTEETEDAEATDITDAEEADSDGSVTYVTRVHATAYAEIDIADYGTVTVALDGDTAPLTVANFTELAESGFYDGLTFHRIIDGFMMQGGDPNGDGTGGADETIVGEFTVNGYENDLSHTAGAISMARLGTDYNSATSQFFIVDEDSTYLDGEYAVFGYVVEGMDIVHQICDDAEPTDSNGTISAEQQPVISSVRILSVEDYETKAAE